MNIYFKKQRWKSFLLLGAILIVLISLWYTNILVKKIADDERKKVRLWANTIQRKANLVRYTNELFRKIENEERQKIELWAEANRQSGRDLSDYTFVLEVIKNNQTIPVLVTDEKGNLLLWKNLDSARIRDKEYIHAQMDTMRAQHLPIEIEILPRKKNFLYYRDSRLFSELKTVFNELIRSFISEVAVNSASVPVIYTDSSKTNVIAFGNIDTLNARMNDSLFVHKFIKEISLPPIEVDLGDGRKTFIFYKESFLLTQLRYYPYLQFGIIGIFLLISYILFSTARKAEQDHVWLGMAKETAHQLGTPLSSILAWIEYLKIKGVDEQTLFEARKDVKRLATITERFSKIGSLPVLEKADIVEVVTKAVDYMKTRISKEVTISVLLRSHAINERGPLRNKEVRGGQVRKRFSCLVGNQDLRTQPGEGIQSFVEVPESIPSTRDKSVVYVNINVPLFEWVIENLCRNAVDAMNGNGTITVEVADHGTGVYVDITDTGKGIPRSGFKTIFQPGYTTKQRGWGLGLSLAKRIIENYHKGKIFVKRSEIGKGSTFRIVLYPNYEGKNKRNE